MENLLMGIIKWFTIFKFNTEKARPDRQNHDRDRDLDRDRGMTIADLFGDLFTYSKVSNKRTVFNNRTRGDIILQKV